MAGIDERRAGFQKYKEDVKARGKPFYPYAMFHDTVMSLVVVLVIIGLTCVWYFTSSPNPETCGSGDSCLLGPRYSEPADPGTTNFVPRPDWYFYFLFYLLRIFKWPDTVILGTVGIPTILLIILIILPFVDLRRERRLLRRPVALVAAGGARERGRPGCANLGCARGIREQCRGDRGREDLRELRVHGVPYLPRHRQLEPGCTRPEQRRHTREVEAAARRLHQGSVEVRQQRDAEVRLQRRTAQPARDVPGRLQGPKIGPRCVFSLA